MLTELLANNFSVQQAGNGGAITASQTAVNVSAAAPSTLQSGQFRVKWLDGTGEIGIVTAGQSGTTWTITRGAEGTTASAHVDGAVIAHILTAGGLQNGLTLPAINFAEAAGDSYMSAYTPPGGTSPNGIVQRIAQVIGARSINNQAATGA